ncbi:TetR/AcrR family transcriptional regulator [Frondihabitans cladoniiphilus]|uniref:TetR/AcrR family transcriptional regulator n=1 Tax=Frondihabitans cladoniiphilus TaxID=715785 RepID=A0ABP8W4I4_9MICO
MSEATDDSGRASDVRFRIVDVTRRLLAWAPYNDVGIRLVAREAGVSPSLVMKYFGSKENLVIQATDFSDEFTELLAGPVDGLARRIVESLAVIPEAPEGTDPLGALLFIAGSRGLPVELRHALLDQFVSRLAGLLEGPDAQARAEVACAILVGGSVMRRTLQAPVLGALEAASLADRIAPLVQAQLDPPHDDGSRTAQRNGE